MIKKLPIGIDNFETLITENYYFVDKSLLIKELLDTKAAVTLIPRPRRFGKTLNLSMVRHFFEKSEPNKRGLFNGLNIEKHDSCMAHQGQYPVIFLTFKEAKASTWQTCYEKITRIIANEFSRHAYLLDSSVLGDRQKKDFTAVINCTASQSIYENALQDLSAFLAKYHGKKAYILIDEYDAPIHAGFLNGYYNEVVEFMRGFLGAGLKGNDNLEMGVITGILRVARESIFSGLNNLVVCSFLSHFYSDKFGLLEDEVCDLLKHFKIPYVIDEVKSWYNGYASGDDYTVYNPWSIINFAFNQGKLQSYWINTSDNALIKEIIEKNPAHVRNDLEQLLVGKVVEKHINENIVFESILQNAESLWSFLLLTGYLSFKKTYLRNKRLWASLCLPNDEVTVFYETIIFEWLERRVDMTAYINMLNTLVNGDIELFKDTFYDFVLTSFSAFDATDNEPEKFYHAFVLGMLISLNETHEIISNRETGLGRADVTIVPKNKNLCGIIIEFKKVRKARNETLEQAADAALEQIETKKYDVEMKKKKIKTIIKLGIAFEGKQVLIKSA